MENNSDGEKSRLIESDLVANNWLPAAMAVLALGLNPSSEDLEYVAAFFGSGLALGHGIQFAEACLNRSMAVRRYVRAVFTGGERVRGENSLY